jgi:hypothetical protein
VRKTIQIMRLVSGSPPPPPVKSKLPMFTPDMLATSELKANRLAICGPCRFNDDGVCRQCCGGMKIETLVYLTASRCRRGFW